MNILTASPLSDIGITFINSDTIALQEQVLNTMTQGIAVFGFQKSDGTIRTAIGTLDHSRIPSKDHPKGTGTKKPNPDVQSFYDLQAMQWKSYKKASLISMLTF